MEAFLQFGGAALDMPNGPYQTIKTDVREDLLDWQKRGLQQTASGYGRKLVTPYKVLHNGKWRRVYCCQISNAGTYYIGKPGAWEATVDIYRV